MTHKVLRINVFQVSLPFNHINDVFFMVRSYVFILLATVVRNLEKTADQRCTTTNWESGVVFKQ